MNILIYDDNLKDIEHLLFCLNGLFQKTNLDYQTHICKSKTEVIQNISKADNGIKLSGQMPKTSLILKSERSFYFSH